MPDLFEVNIETNIGSLVDALIQLEGNVDRISKFVAPQIITHIKRDVFGTLVRDLASSAGEFPTVYLNHLLAFLQQLPIETEVSDGLFIRIDFDALGNESDYEAGFHDQAVFEGDDFIHPGKVDLPYAGQDLINDQERREEFWEQVIVNRDVQGFLNAALDNRQYGNRTLQMVNALTTIFGRTNFPTWEQVAAKRVAAWIGLGVAPEWLLLEYGSAKSGSQPVVEPVDFLERIEAACQCIADQIVQNALSGILEVFDREEAAGNLVNINVLGRPYFAAGQGSISGRFVTYKDIAPNISQDINLYECLEY